jgi:hypothetical protein
MKHGPSGRAVRRDASSSVALATHAGQVVDVCLELWAIFVVTAVAGSFASFFLAGDR